MTSYSAQCASNRQLVVGDGHLVVVAALEDQLTHVRERSGARPPAAEYAVPSPERECYLRTRIAHR
ncbi:hypothetical protein ABZ917_23615 [Nonomuraea wenchangensis]